MGDLSLITTARSRKLHVTASSIRSHLRYRDEYVATLCGQWLQVHDMYTDVNLDDVNEGQTLSEVARRSLGGRPRCPGRSSATSGWRFVIGCIPIFEGASNRSVRLLVLTRLISNPMAQSDSPRMAMSLVSVISGRAGGAAGRERTKTNAR
jgi:hypothetical protein